MQKREVVADIASEHDDLVPIFRSAYLLLNPSSPLPPPFNDDNDDFVIRTHALIIAFSYFVTMSNSNFTLLSPQYSFSHSLSLPIGTPPETLSRRQQHQWPGQHAASRPSVRHSSKHVISTYFILSLLNYVYFYAY